MSPGIALSLLVPVGVEEIVEGADKVVGSIIFVRIVPCAAIQGIHEADLRD